MAPFSKLIKFILLALLRAYQYLVSPLLGPRCRFYPSCSEYACDAVKHYNPFYAFWLIIKRLLRCHPLCEGGVDPIPLTKKKSL